MNENTSQTLIFLGLLAAAVALILTGHGGWVLLLMFFGFMVLA